MKVRQRPGRAGRCGDRKPRRQAEIFQPRGKIGDQFVFAAEQMRRAFDVEEETVGAVLFTPRRGGRRVARRPQGDAAQRGIVGCGIDCAHLQPVGFGPRIGQGFADRKACGFRRLVQGGDVQAAARSNGEDEGPVRIDRLVCRGERLRREKARDRPVRQPN